MVVIRVASRCHAMSRCSGRWEGWTCALRTSLVEDVLASVVLPSYHPLISERTAPWPVRSGGLETCVAWINKITFRILVAMFVFCTVFPLRKEVPNKFYLWFAMPQIIPHGNRDGFLICTGTFSILCKRLVNIARDWVFRFKYKKTCCMQRSGVKCLREKQSTNIPVL